MILVAPQAVDCGPFGNAFAASGAPCVSVKCDGVTAYAILRREVASADQRGESWIEPWCVEPGKFALCFVLYFASVHFDYYLFSCGPVSNSPVSSGPQSSFSHEGRPADLLGDFRPTKASARPFDWFDSSDGPLQAG
jgi:hypothetical protein